MGREEGIKEEVSFVRFPLALLLVAISDSIRTHSIPWESL